MKNLIKSFHLEGKITEQHAKDIEEILENREKEIIKEIEKLPTGMFDSTPYKKDLINIINKK